MYMSSWFCTAQIFMFVVIPTYTSSVSYAATFSHWRRLGGTACGG